MVRVAWRESSIVIKYGNVLSNMMHVIYVCWKGPGPIRDVINCDPCNQYGVEGLWRFGLRPSTAEPLT